MRRYLGTFLTATTLLLLPLSTALAWWDEGHMQIALMAYNKLSDHARTRAGGG